MSVHSLIIRSSAAPAAAPTDAPTVDPRGLRFAAALTSVVLALVLVTGNGWLLAVQALAFALGAIDQSPYGLLFRGAVRPRLGPPAHLEDARPPRFAQVVGLVFATLGVVGFATGIDGLALAATAAALVAAFVNAAFGVCLGCELYLLFHRTVRRTPASHEEVRSP